MLLIELDVSSDLEAGAESLGYRYASFGSMAYRGPVLRYFRPGEGGAARGATAGGDGEAKGKGRGKGRQGSSSEGTAQRYFASGTPGMHQTDGNPAEVRNFLVFCSVCISPVAHGHHDVHAGEFCCV